jgi:hypothetical protein
MAAIFLARAGVALNDLLNLNLFLEHVFPYHGSRITFS